MAQDRPVIAHVLHRLDRAGAEVLAAGLARSLRDRFESVFFCLDGLGPLAEELSGEGFAVESLGREPGIDRAVSRKLEQRLTHHRVSLVHAHQHTPFFYSALARGVVPRRGQLPARAILFTEHGRHYPDTRSLKRCLLNKALLREQDRVTAVGQFVRRALVRNEAIPAKRIDVVYNGIEPGPEPTDDDRAAARRLLGIDPGRPVVMQVARFHPVKDHDTAIRAWTNVHKAIPDALLVLVGDGEGRAAIQTMAAERGLQDAVQFTGAVDNARQLIPAADLCMLTSLSEGVSVTLLEAMAAALPVVATDVGGNPEVVEHGKTGMLAPRRDAATISQTLIKLLPNAPYARLTLGMAGRERLLKRFTADRMHAGYAQLYESIAGDSRS